MDFVGKNLHVHFAPRQAEIRTMPLQSLSSFQEVIRI